MAIINITKLIAYDPVKNIQWTENVKSIRVCGDFFTYFDLEFGSTCLANNVETPRVKDLINQIEDRLDLDARYKYEIKPNQQAVEKVLPVLKKVNKNYRVRF